MQGCIIAFSIFWMRLGSVLTLSYSMLQFLMKSQRSLSSNENQPQIKRTPKISVKMSDRQEAHQKSTGTSQGSSKKLKLRDYLYIHQLSEKKRSLQKPNTMSHSKNMSFNGFNDIHTNNATKVTLLKHNRRRIQAQEVFDAVRKEIEGDLDAIVDTIIKMRSGLDTLPKSSINQSLMIQLYDIRHKIKYNSLVQLKQYEQKISNRKESMPEVAPFEHKMRASQSITIIESLHQSREQRKPNEQHKVCMLKRRESNRR